jgi:hypothetical protein
VQTLEAKVIAEKAAREKRLAEARKREAEREKAAAERAKVDEGDGYGKQRLHDFVSGAFRCE